MRDIVDLTRSLDVEKFVPKVYDWEFPIYLMEFSGPIGSGKSETAEELYNIVQNFKGRGWDVRHLTEDIWSKENKAAIDDFYSGRGNPVELEKQICGKRVQMLLDTINSHEDVCPMLIISDRAIEDDLEFVNKLIGEYENCKSSLLSIYSNIEDFVCAMDDIDSAIMHTTIRLEPTLDEALDRIRKRGRPNEQQINKSTLGKLAGKPSELFCKDAVVIDNTSLTVLETATLSALVVFNRLGIVDNVLISVYGVPGVGKSKFAKELSKRLHIYEPKTSQELEFSVFDRSEDEEVVSEQKLIYEKEETAISPDTMQNIIDERRLEDFRNVELCKIPPLIGVTDVGSWTSEVFRKVTKCVCPFGKYREWFERRFHKYLNVVIVAEGGFKQVQEHIKMRGRPGETEYFTIEKLRQIDLAIFDMDSQCSFDTQRPICFLENGYTEQSLTKMFHETMKALYKLVRFSR